MSGRADKTFFLETFGCQMNFLDSELVLGQLRRMGFSRTADRDRADLILFNTCSVRQHAEQKVNSRLGELRQVKADRPGAVIAVLGCQAEREGRGLLGRFPHVDILCGPNELDKLPGLVLRVQAERKRALALSGGLKGRRGRPAAGASVGEDLDGLEALDGSRSFAPGETPLQAYVRVQRGCDKFCAFCIVPTVRGRERSRPPGHILAEVRRLADAGCREVTLLGQTVNSYLHADGGGRTTGLAGLLEQVSGVEGLLRVRFVTNYPGGFDEDILRAMAGCGKVCPYLHMPAQSGSDRMLRAMRRQYTSGDYYRLMDRARQLVPGVSLAGDFIVGFPGETEADFAATEEMVRRVGYKNCFVFKYSPRPGTAAFRLADDVPEAVKRERNHRLLAVQAEISARANAELIGRSVNILVEGYSKLGAEKRGRSSFSGPSGHGGPPPRQLTGRTIADQIVVFDPPAGSEVSALVGRLAQVRITAVTPYTLIGELVGGADGEQGPSDPMPLRYKSLTVLR